MTDTDDLRVDIEKVRIKDMRFEDTTQVSKMRHTKSGANLHLPGGNWFSGAMLTMFARRVDVVEIETIDSPLSSPLIDSWDTSCAVAATSRIIWKRRKKDLIVPSQDKLMKGLGYLDAVTLWRWWVVIALPRFSDTNSIHFLFPVAASAREMLVSLGLYWPFLCPFILSQKESF